MDVDALIEAFKAGLRGDHDAWVRLLGPDVEWDISAHPLPDVPTRGHGRDALLAGWAVYLSGRNNYRAEITAVVSGDDKVVITVGETARMLQTDVVLDRDLIYLLDVGDDGVACVRVFKTEREALDAAGLPKGPTAA